MSLASRIASASSVKRKRAATGPNVSSCASAHLRLCSRSKRSARRTCRRALWRLTAGDDLGATLPTASAMCSSTLASAALSMSGPWVDARLHAGPDLKAAPPRRRAAARTRHSTPSCTRMRLTQTQVWPVLRYFEAIAPFDRGVEIGVVENDEGRVAAELHGELLQRPGALRHQKLADLGRTGEGELADGRIRPSTRRRSRVRCP